MNKKVPFTPNGLQELQAGISIRPDYMIRRSGRLCVAKILLSVAQTMQDWATLQ
jgi:hypothetical protein